MLGDCFCCCSILMEAIRGVGQEVDGTESHVAFGYCSSHHLESRRDFPDPGPPDTSRGGVGGGAAIMSFKRSIY